MTEHSLKCWPEHYAAIERGVKSCELRLNDRLYQVGDALLLKEWEPLENSYTGRELRARVTHILNGGVWLAPGYIAMSIRRMAEDNTVRLDTDWKTVADRQRDDLATLRQQFAEAQEAAGIARVEIEQVRGILEAMEDETLVKAAQWLVQEERTTREAYDNIHRRYWKELMPLARALDASIKGDGNGRCWCGAREADALRGYLERAGAREGA